MHKDIRNRIRNVATKLSAVLEPKTAEVDHVTLDLYHNLVNCVSALNVELGIEYEETYDSFLAIGTLGDLIKNATDLRDRLQLKQS